MANTTAIMDEETQVVIKKTQELQIGDVIIALDKSFLILMSITWAGGDNYRVEYWNSQTCSQYEAIERVNSKFETLEWA